MCLRSGAVVQWFSHVCRMNAEPLQWQQRRLTSMAATTRTLENPTRCASEGMWVQTEDQLKSQRLNLDQVKVSGMDRKVWKNVIDGVQHPAAPEGREADPPPPTPTSTSLESKETKKIICMHIDMCIYRCVCMYVYVRPPGSDPFLVPYVPVLSLHPHQLIYYC